MEVEITIKINVDKRYYDEDELKEQLEFILNDGIAYSINSIELENKYE